MTLVCEVYKLEEDEGNEGHLKQLEQLTEE